jgi:hypothetical protein
LGQVDPGWVFRFGQADPGWVSGWVRQTQAVFSG